MRVIVINKSGMYHCRLFNFYLLLTSIKHFRTANIEHQISSSIISLTSQFAAIRIIVCYGRCDRSGETVVTHRVDWLANMIVALFTTKRIFSARYSLIRVYTNTVETLYSTIYHSKYFIELNTDKSTQYGALWTQKRHYIPRPFGRAMECLLWLLQQKLIVL